MSERPVTENTVTKHFVTFLSPGSFYPEKTHIEIDSWDVDQAAKMASGIVERHGATPYGFTFSTRSRGPEDLDSHVTLTSGIYYFKGLIETLAEVEARNDPDEEILRLNMRSNDIPKVITLSAGRYSFKQYFQEEDKMLEVEAPPAPPPEAPL